MTLDEEAGEFTITMHRCPSKGMLLGLEHLEPYHDYCAHCATLYRRALEPLGYEYEMDLSDCDQARWRWWRERRVRSPSGRCRVERRIFRCGGRRIRSAVAVVPPAPTQKGAGVLLPPLPSAVGEADPLRRLMPLRTRRPGVRSRVQTDASADLGLEEEHLGVFDPALAQVHAKPPVAVFRVEACR